MSRERIQQPSQSRTRCTHRVLLRAICQLRPEYTSPARSGQECPAAEHCPGREPGTEVSTICSTFSHSDASGSLNGRDFNQTAPLTDRLRDVDEREGHRTQEILSTRDSFFDLRAILFPQNFRHGVQLAAVTGRAEHLLQRCLRTEILHGVPLCSCRRPHLDER